jgi:error-prone DNA polymerase
MKRRDSYAPIHCRSHYSLLQGLASPGELCEEAAALGAGAVGIADINSFYGLLRFAVEASRRGLKALYGVAVHRRGKHLCTLFCRNGRGFARANEIIGGLLASEDYDPVEELCSGGWRGLAVVVRDAGALQRLAAGARTRGEEELYAGLVYGYPYDGMRRLAKSLGLPLFAFNDAVYLEEERRGLFGVVRAIGENRLVSTLPPDGGLGEAEKLVGAERMRRFFSGVPEAMENAARFVREAEGFSLPRSFVFPSFRGLSEERAFDVLRRLCLRGLERRYGRSYGPGVSERLEYELSIIRRKGFSSYFLVVNDVVRRFPRTCGRGSSAASLVSYALGITHVDPLAHNLFFERFLNEERTDPPDIDVDFPWDEREQALEYVFRRYSGRVGMVADHVTFGPRSALREAARVLGYEKDMQDRFERLRRRGETGSLPDILRQSARLLYGMPRHIGTHPGGVVITPGPITDYTHVQTSPMGRPVIAWEKDGTEDAGLVKIDLLGNRSLGVLRDCLAEINGTYGTRIEWESFNPLGNLATRRLIEEGKTLGVFYVESPATRQLLQKMGTGDYEHLVAASSIIRPAANRYINEYVRRLRGGAYRRLPEPMGQVLEETCGIMVYQEDVSRIAVAAAGFGHGEADGLRKVLSKKDRSVRLPAFRRKFIEGGERRGFSAELLEELWNGILSFDGYSFCKPHSASYALLSYRLAWVKRHFPLVFFTSVLNNGGGFYSPQVYVNETRRHGFAVLGPDVNESELLYSVDYARAGLRVGLARMRDLDRHTAERIVETRRAEGAFSDALDFLRRVRPDAASLRSLIRSGSLDSISCGYTRPQLFWLSYHRAKSRGLFGLPPVPEEIGDYPPPEKLRDEVRFTGLFLRSHPLEIFFPRISLFAGPPDGTGSDTGGPKTPGKPAAGTSDGPPPLIDSRRLPSFVGREVRIAGYLVTEKEVRTKDRREMSFVSFEDAYGIFETVLFPEAYGELGRILEDAVVFLLEGSVEREWGALQLVVRNLISLNRGRGRV